MTDYNKRLELLLEKYELKKEQCIWKEEVSKIIQEGMQKLIEEKQYDNPQIAIWGAGEHTEYLLELDFIHSFNIICIVDKNKELVGEKIGDFIIQSIDTINSMNIDIVIISSYAHRKDIKEELNIHFPAIQTFDIYNTDRKIYRKPFYPKKSKDINEEVYSDLIYCTNWYESERNEKSLYYLIQECLAIRDFVSAKYLINAYICARYEHSDKMYLFINELEGLLSEIKIKLSKSEQENILFIILDSLRSKDLNNENHYTLMPYLKSMSEKSLNFTNAFSPGLYTKESLRAIFSEEQLFIKKTFEIEKIGCNNSMFFKELKRKGYEFFNFSGLDFFDDQTFVNVGGQWIYSPASKKLWKYICEKLKFANKKNFSYVHLMEPHSPYLCCYLGEIHERHKISINNMCEETVKYFNAIQYVDIQLEFYLELLPKKETIVICSDHGNRLIKWGYYDYEISSWGDNEIHAICLIKNKKYKGLQINNLFSTKNLCKHIIDAIHGKTINVDNQSHIIAERTPLYNHYVKYDFISKGLAKQIQGIRMIRTEREKYFIYEDGTEEYYLLTDERVNLIDDPAYSNRVEFFRNLEENKYFPDFNNL